MSVTLLEIQMLPLYRLCTILQCKCILLRVSLVPTELLRGNVEPEVIDNLKFIIRMLIIKIISLLTILSQIHYVFSR